MLYTVTFTINIPQMLAYIPYMDPMGYGNYIPDVCIFDANMAWNIVHKSLARRNILWNSSWAKGAEMQVTSQTSRIISSGNQTLLAGQFLMNGGFNGTNIELNWRCDLSGRSWPGIYVEKYSSLGGFLNWGYPQFSSILFSDVPWNKHQ